MNFFKKLIKFFWPSADFPSGGPSPDETRREVSPMDSPELDSAEDELVPEALKRRWEAESFEEEIRGKPSRSCLKCGGSVEGDAFYCLFCGERILEEAGSLSRLAHLTKTNPLILLFILFVVILLWMWIL